MSCGLQMPLFGANYPDAICVDGYMCDADAGDKQIYERGRRIEDEHTCRTISFGQNIRESNQNPVWRFAFNAATEEGNGAPREVLKFSRKRDELIWIKKGEYSAYTIPVDELKRLPRDR